MALLYNKILHKPEGWDGERDGREVQKGGDNMYTYGWFMLMFDRKQQNSVKQLSFNKLKKKKKYVMKYQCYGKMFVTCIIVKKYNCV